ncbi:MAG: Pyruvate synthase subunit PorB [Candidatus Syntrophoarchaeum sp. GoM_oil]|nr:MAG: Pyruvate synthase subunit PorB [Candidatus Syntrophoarchaeum sp. GoM_oil]
MKNLFASGHRACAGCGMAIAVNLILEATGEKVFVVSPTGCLEIVSSPYPETSWKVPWIHSLFENTAAVASGIEAGLKALGRKNEGKVLAIGGDGATADIGMGALSGMFERGHDVTYICYDNEAYMNTGVQRSSMTPIGMSATTTPSGKISYGEIHPKKDLTSIAVAHGVGYVATTSAGYALDLMDKVKRAVDHDGTSFIHLHSSCCTGWRHPGSKTVEIMRLAVLTGLWPLYEVVDGETANITRLPKRLPVEDYLKPQGRYAHLFKTDEGAEVIKAIQAMADINAERYGLDEEE